MEQKKGFTFMIGTEKRRTILIGVCDALKSQSVRCFRCV